MNQSPVPSLATNRVEALHSYHILDSAAEADYDNIAQLAAQLCQTPIAQINFVDETRQWVKANRAINEIRSPSDQTGNPTSSLGSCHQKAQGPTID